MKLRERERQRVDLGRSLKGHLYRWWMVDILSLMLYTKVGCFYFIFILKDFNIKNKSEMRVLIIAFVV